MLPSKYLRRLMKCSAFKFARTEAPKVTRLNQSTGGNTNFSESTEDLTYAGELSKHRNLLPLRAKKHMPFQSSDFPFCSLIRLNPYPFGSFSSEWVSNLESMETVAFFTWRVWISPPLFYFIYLKYIIYIKGSAWLSSNIMTKNWMTIGMRFI